MTGPYAEAAWAYRRAGWAGVLPLPPGAKWPPPGGYTGWAGIEPSGADVQAWVDGPEGAGNVCLRLSNGVYGLDVDDYAGKTGGLALGQLVERLGPLPATWIVSSREESLSGIRLFRAELPAGRRWRDEPAGHGAGIEAIHVGHRYAVTWPSLHPDTGRKYVLHRPDGLLAAEGEIPRPDELPALPAAWVDGLSEVGEVRAGEMAGHAETVEVVTAWREGEACARVADACARAGARLRGALDGDALHPAGRDATQELVLLGHEGHVGVRRALAEHYSTFVEVRAAREGARADARGKAAAEWWRLVRGAVGKLAGPARASCDCALWAGEGLIFSREELLRGGDAAASEPQEVEGGDAVPEVVQRPSDWGVPVDLIDEVATELHRLRIRDYAVEIHRAQQHGRSWRAPESYGTLADELLIPDDAPQWRIHGLLGNGHNAILVAGRKVGKTTMVNEFVRSYVDGEPFLGAQEVTSPDGGIAIFNYEVDERQYRRWLRSVGIRNAHLVHILHLRGRSLPLANDRVRAWVTAWLRERSVSGWILDPYSRAYIGSIDNGNDETQVSALLDTLDVIKSEAGVRELVIPVHTPKARVEEGEETAIGSQRLEAWPDVLWFLTRDGGTRFLRAEGRDIEFSESALEFNNTTRRLTVELFGQDRKSRRLAGQLEKLIHYVHKNPGCTQNAIMSALGWNGKTVSEVVNASGDRVVREPGPGRSLIHFLKEDVEA